MPLVDAAARRAWFEQAVQQPDFLDDNFLSDDRRYSVREIGTNVARAMGSNARKGQDASDHAPVTATFND